MSIDVDQAPDAAIKIPVQMPAELRPQTAFRRVGLVDVKNAPAPIFHDAMVDPHVFSTLLIENPEEVFKEQYIIKAPETDIFIPAAVSSVTPFVKDVFNLQAEQGYDVRNLWARLHVHQGYIRAGRVLNVPHIHVDAGTRLLCRTFDGNSRHYSACNINPTSFFPGPIDRLSLDLNYYREHDATPVFQKALEDHMKAATPMRGRPYQIVESEAVLPHIETPSDETGLRTFVMVRLFEADSALGCFYASERKINNLAAYEAWQKTKHFSLKQN